MYRWLGFHVIHLYNYYNQTATIYLLETINNLTLSLLRSIILYNIIK